VALVVEDERTLALPIVDIPPNVLSSSVATILFVDEAIVSRSSDKPNADLAANKFLFLDDDEDDIARYTILLSAAYILNIGLTIHTCIDQEVAAALVPLPTQPYYCTDQSKANFQHITYLSDIRFVARSILSFYSLFAQQQSA